MKLKDIFGKPREGVHKYRIADIAVVDVIATFLAAWAISYYYHQTYWHVLLALFILGIVLHRLLGVDTTVNRWI